MLHFLTMKKLPEVHCTRITNAQLCFAPVCRLYAHHMHVWVCYWV